MQSLVPSAVFTSGVGIAAVGISETMEDSLSTGSTQVVLSIFVVVLLTGVTYLFKLLMNTIQKGHSERDDREAKFNSLFIRMNETMLINSELMKETTEAVKSSRCAMEEMTREMRMCHDLRIKKENG